MKCVVKIQKEEHPKMTTSNIIVLVAFAFYMLVMIAIGVIYSRKTKNNEDYFLGGRNLGGWTAALSAQASDMSGWLLMGLPGSVYLAGTGEVWIAVGLLLGTILNWFLVSSRLRKYTIVAGNSLTIPSFFQNRYRDKTGAIKIVSAIIIAVFFAVYTASAFSSGAKLFATLFGNSANGEMDGTAYLIGLIIASVVILIYTFMGGFKAVCTTDFIQGLLMLVAILAVPIVAYASITSDQSFSQALAAKGVENPDNYLNFLKNTDGTRRLLYRRYRKSLPQRSARRKHQGNRVYPSDSGDLLRQRRIYLYRRHLPLRYSRGYHVNRRQSAPRYRFGCFRGYVQGRYQKERIREKLSPRRQDRRCGCSCYRVLHCA